MIQNISNITMNSSLAQGTGSLGTGPAPRGADGDRVAWTRGSTEKGGHGYANIPNHQ